MMFVLHPREEEWGTSSVGRTFIRSCSPHVVGRQTAFASPNATERCRRVNQAQGLPSLMCRFVANESGLSCNVLRIFAYPTEFGCGSREYNCSVSQE